MKKLIKELLEKHDWAMINMIANSCGSDEGRRYLYEINNIIKKMKDKG